MRIGERIRWTRGYDPFENQIERAEYAIYKLQTPEKEWFTELLNILKNEQYARIVGKNGKELDVQRIAYTYSYASFFDVINKIYLFDINIKPIVIKELNNTLNEFYGHSDYV